VGEGNTTLSLPVLLLPNGYYFVRVSGGGNPSALRKVSIIH